MNRKLLSPVILSSIFLLNLVLRSLYAGSRDIAMDEPFSIFYARQTAGEIFGFFNSARENNPPFYFLLLHYWMELFGESPFAIRLLSVLSSSLAAAVIFQTGRRYLDLFSGVVAALAFTFSTLHIYYAHEARAYALFTLLASLSLYFYLGIMKNPRDKLNYVFIFLSNLLLIYSHYFGFFVVCVEMLCFFCIPDKGSAWKGLLAVFISLAVCYLPHLYALVDRLTFTSTSGTWVAAPALSEYYGNLNRFLNTRYCMVVLIAGLAIGFFISARYRAPGLWLRGLSGDPVLRIVFLWFFVPYTAMFLVSFKMPMFIDRYILYTSVPFYILIGGAFRFFIENRRAGYVLSGAFLLSMMLTVQLDPDNKRRLKEATDIVRKLKKEETMVIIAPHYSDLGFAYHYKLDYFKDYRNLRKSLEGDKIYPVTSAAMAQGILEGQEGDCIYFQADSRFVDPENSILKAIADKYPKHSEQKVFEIYTIHHFSN